MPRWLLIVVVAACTSQACLSPIPLDRARAAEYRKRYEPGCTILPNLVSEAKAKSQSAASPGEAPKGSLDKSAIQAVVTAQAHEAQACYNEALLAWPELNGRVAIRFEIAADGSVGYAIVADDDTGVFAVGCCIAQQLRGWKFPEPASGGKVIVIYPFVLKRRW
jgi:hypothetical protein